MCDKMRIRKMIQLGISYELSLRRYEAAHTGIVKHQVG